jgi:cell division protein FtsW
MQSFRSGGLLGVGFGQGLHKAVYLPAPHTDFILAVTAEEAGVLGVLLIILLFMVILARGLGIASAARDDFSKLLAAGLTIIIVAQALINMGVVTGILPTTGIVLPFISYGGSSLFANMTAVGILLNIHKSNIENRGVPG